METRQFDLITVGTGSAASGVTFRLKKAGWNVAAIEERPPGGVCSQWGCDPKKVLRAAAEAMDWITRMGPKGVEVGDPHISWPLLMKFKEEFTESIPDSTRKKYADAGVPLFEEHAHFEGPNVLRVGDSLLSADRIHLACGAKPRALGIPGEEFLMSSDDFLQLDTLPQRIVFVGGGYISFEFAHIAVRAGAKVTILQRGDRALRGFDSALVDKLVAASREVGIEVHLGADVNRVERIDKGFCVNCRKEGAPTVEADLIVHGAGRVPNIDDMDLKKGNVSRTDRGIAVNSRMESISNASVTAAGDCADSGAPLTPVAGYEASIVAKNILGDDNREADYRGMASAAFTIPAIARAGALEEELREKEISFDVREGDTSTWYSNRRINAKTGGYRTFIEKETGKILGAHLLGNGAAETINLFAVAIRKGLKRKDLRDVLWAYPSHFSDINYMI